MNIGSAIDSPKSVIHAVGDAHNAVRLPSTSLAERTVYNGCTTVRRSHARHDAPDHGAVSTKENAKHVLRALKESARQGFWNGSLPPIGYRAVAAEQRGAEAKKKLEIDPLHAVGPHPIKTNAAASEYTFALSGPAG
jgi:hypothetical protein